MHLFQLKPPAALEAWQNTVMAAQMTDAHRRFLQLLMSNGITEGSEARKLHQHCCETDKGVSVLVMKELGFFPGAAYK